MIVLTPKPKLKDKGKKVAHGTANS